MPMNQEHDQGDHKGNGSIAKWSAAIGGWGADTATGQSCHRSGPESHDILALGPEVLPILLIYPKFHTTRNGTLSTCTRP